MLQKIQAGFFRDYFVKGFKAPHWRYSLGTLQALKELGFWVAVLPGWKFHPSLNGIKYYSIEVNSLEVYYFQGHFGNVCNNGIQESFHILSNLKDTGQFRYVSDMLKEFNGTL